MILKQTKNHLLGFNFIAVGAECLHQYGNSMSSIEYGSKINEKIVIIHPEERSRNMSLFAYIHGGYWQDGRWVNRYINVVYTQHCSATK